MTITGGPSWSLALAPAFVPVRNIACIASDLCLRPTTPQGQFACTGCLVASPPPALP